MRIFGLILAGGAGQRMGGADKALLPFGAGSLLSSAIERFEPQVEMLALSANGDPARFGAFDLPVLPDKDGGGAGPMAGLLAGLDWAGATGATHLATMAVDTPFIPGDLVARLMLAGDGGPAIAESADRAHPTAGLWPVALRAPLEAALARAERRLGQWADQVGAARATFPATEPDPFMNVNTQEELATAARYLD
ncbi:molybdenum cofactor guanylyltransferase [Frigidibacter sp. RF13]|uniref:molybdenum cofactor guanylyltransferase MobA n=1 Tax=Frigidibacter sp. RF13 TaxID=2997340 RepID=UPI0022703643|nr:molybdenum cofactor guanylyltransferase MobA [Frigidibacter sp. RF13]MCY1127710.1 molybdenum cofactor guanylyltransferase [Frigidibacter sp. RF13]